MDRTELQKIFNKHVNGYLEQDRMSRFEDIPARIFIDAMEEALRIHDVISWVAVEDKMPESGQCVLIYSKNGGVAEGAWLSAKGHFEQWRWNCVQKGVTHWAELPEPPCL